jgi:CheY-like chemotaxis protein
MLPHLALLVVLQQVLAAGAARVRALGVVAAQNVRPQLLAHAAAAPKLALVLALLALGAVPQEQQPPLLLLDVLLPVLQVLLQLLTRLLREACSRRNTHNHPRQHGLNDSQQANMICAEEAEENTASDKPVAGFDW